jgi:hypothetical protein
MGRSSLEWMCFFIAVVQRGSFLSVHFPCELRSIPLLPRLYLPALAMCAKFTPGALPSQQRQSRRRVRQGRQRSGHVTNSSALALTPAFWYDLP